MFWRWAEKRFLFSPDCGVDATPESESLEYDDVFINTPDGLRLHAWFIPAPPGANGTRVQTWLWFHGNGGNLGTRVGQLARAHHLLGVNQLIFDYRGYGNSEGRPTERGTYLDARAALYYLRGRMDVDPDCIVYFGHSLGAAVAIELAVAHRPAGMALVAPFSSIKDMAGLVMPVPLIGWLVRGHYNSMSRIGKVHTPLLILHGELDEIVPHSQGFKLYRAANRPKRFVTLYNASHNNVQHVAGDVLAQALLQFRNGVPLGDVAPSYTPPTISV